MPRPPSFDEPDVDDKPGWVRSLPRLDDSARGPERVERSYRNRLQMLLSLDEMVAGLMKEMEVTGNLDNTYVFFTSDNGYHLGKHRGRPGQAHGLRGGRASSLGRARPRGSCRG